MIAVDWSYTKDLTTFDGRKVRVETKEALLKRLEKESIKKVQSNNHHRFLVLEQGCPISLIFYFVRHGVEVKTISNRATEEFRKANKSEKSDEADARIIYGLASNGAVLQPMEVNNRLIQMQDVYHQYCRYQKARVAMQNMKKAHRRTYGDGGSESNRAVESTEDLQLPDLSPYDIAIDTLEAREKTLLKKLEQIYKGIPLFEEAGGESSTGVLSNRTHQPPAIKGLGTRIWLGILVTANPGDFKCLSAYLRFCGLTNNTFSETHKYNRHARMLYHMLAGEILKQRDPKFRPIYDKCKVDLAEKHIDYTKGHIHNAAMARVSTFLAKEIFYHFTKVGDR